jgi:S1-C subfamily serine protease
MKKLLGIVVLGLLWCNVSSSSSASFFVTYKHYHTDKEYTYNGFGNESLYEVGIVAKKQCERDSEIPEACLLHSIKKKDGTIAMFWERSIKVFHLAFENIPEILQPEKNKAEKDEVIAASMGSGFFVTRAGHIVTNYHVVEGCNAVKANISGKEIQTDIIAVDKINDLAIIKSKTNPSKVFPVSSEDVLLLQDVVVAGFPLGKKVSAAIKTHKGSVTALAGYGDNYSNFQTDATINQGNSGGPIINQKGNVVGVAVATWIEEGVQGIHFGVKSSTLKTFAKSNSINFTTPNYRDLSNADLGKLITQATVYLECFMTVAKVKKMIAQAENRKAFYSEHQ